MATEVQNPSDQQSLTALVSGIVSDFQDLVKQQLRLTRKEIEADLRKTREAASLFILGSIITLVGALGLCLMLAHLIHWLGLPAGGELSHVPLWAAFAIASAVFLTVGGFTILAGKKKMVAMGTPLHDTAQALKENIEWKTKASPS
jgi:hypothetical protein